MLTNLTEDAMRQLAHDRRARLRAAATPRPVLTATTTTTTTVEPAGSLLSGPSRLVSLLRRPA